jgi:hypothetical protein
VVPVIDRPVIRPLTSVQQVQHGQLRLKNRSVSVNCTTNIDNIGVLHQEEDQTSGQANRIRTFPR